jgi:beta-galactosidase/beta-glucuronidase
MGLTFASLQHDTNPELVAVGRSEGCMEQASGMVWFTGIGRDLSSLEIVKGAWNRRFLVPQRKCAT